MAAMHQINGSQSFGLIMSGAQRLYETSFYLTREAAKSDGRECKKENGWYGIGVSLVRTIQIVTPVVSGASIRAAYRGHPGLYAVGGRAETTAEQKLPKRRLLPLERKIQSTLRLECLTRNVRRLWCPPLPFLPPPTLLRPWPSVPIGGMVTELG